MQYKEAEQLRKNWGGQPCSHPETVKEYYLSSDTGDYVCTTCGESFSRDERP